MFVPYASEIWTKSYGPNYLEILSFLTKNRVFFFFNNHFWQRVDTILEDVSVAEVIGLYWTINLKTIIFQCSKNFGNPTLVTRLKVAPNMADPISLNENLP